MELAAHDEEVRERVLESFDRLETAFQDAILRAQRKGEIPTDREARKLARFLVAAVQGLCVVAKMNPDRQRVADIAEMMVTVLG